MSIGSGSVRVESDTYSDPVTDPDLDSGPDARRFLCNTIASCRRLARVEPYNPQQEQDPVYLRNVAKTKQSTL